MQGMGGALPSPQQQQPPPQQQQQPPPPQPEPPQQQAQEAKLPPAAADGTGGGKGISVEQLQVLMQDEAKLQQFLTENPSMMQEIMKMM